METKFGGSVVRVSVRVYFLDKLSTSGVEAAGGPREGSALRNIG